jgi:hypothetical protein
MVSGGRASLAVASRLRVCLRHGLAAPLARLGAAALLLAGGCGGAPPAPPAGPLAPAELVVFAVPPELPAGREAIEDWDDRRLWAASIQGIVNREQPRLFVESSAQDAYWLQRMRAPSQPLHDVPLVRVATPEELYARFADELSGLVLWDPAVPATQNVAASVAGADELAVLRHDERPSSLYRRVTGLVPAPPVRVDLRGKFRGSGTIPDTSRPSSGSRKCDAYLWLLENYLERGRLGSRYAGYVVDSYWQRRPLAAGAVQSLNLDFLVAHRSLVFDLGHWPDEQPVDEPTQPPGADAATLRELLRALYRRHAGRGITQLCGFVPWTWKYTSAPGAGGRRDPVASEWELVRLASAYNVVLDADAFAYSALANASVWQHATLPRRRVASASPTPQQLAELGYWSETHGVAPRQYVVWHLGDWDAAAWMYQALPRLWDDPRRGSVPLAWSFNPNLMDRFAVGFAHVWATATDRDRFSGGDTVAGYVNVTQLYGARAPSGLPDGRAAFEEFARPYVRRMGLTSTIFALNGSAGPYDAAAYELLGRLSGRGVAYHMAGQTRRGPFLASDVAFVGQSADIDERSLSAGARQVLEATAGAAPGFHVFRSILAAPGFLAELTARLEREHPERRITVVTPEVFFALIELHQGQTPRRRIAFVSDTLPDRAGRGSELAFEVTLRNDGWDTWLPRRHRLGVHVASGPIPARSVPAEPRGYADRFDLPAPVAPGQGSTLRVRLRAPRTAGQYTVQLDLFEEPDTWFETQRNVPWQASLRVE